MSGKVKDSTLDVQDIDSSKKTCFIVMPIANTDGYDDGHFQRVYQHLIKPACSDAGFKPVRADEVSNSNFIVVDILKKIVESDLVICDLSSKNPNVMYELGIRQAFNKPTVLIKDDRTKPVFDIQGIRYHEYHSSLRIDTVQRDTKSISKAITNTCECNPEDSNVNSLIQLLAIQPATIPNSKVLSEDTSVLLSAINGLSEKLVVNNDYNNYQPKLGSFVSERSSISNNFWDLAIGDEVYCTNRNGNHEFLGKLIDIESDGVLGIVSSDKKYIKIGPSDSRYPKLTDIPF